MKGILIVNMGGPESLAEMRKFLFRMFSDRFILPIPFFIRYIVSFLISITRYKSSWKKYKSINGSPVKKETMTIGGLLAEELGSEYFVKCVFSYSSPTINDGIKCFIQKQIDYFKVIPLYPHSSISTTGSVKAEVNKVASSYKKFNFKIIDEFYKEENFILFWQALIQEHIKKNSFKDPMLLFSAHSIPQYLVNKGDTYVSTINKSAQLISEKLKLKFEVSFQSKMGKVKWVGPDTKLVLKQLATKGFDEIIIVPISFVNENLETLYDIDKQIIPFGKQKCGIKNLSRIFIPTGNNIFIRTLMNIITK